MTVATPLVLPGDVILIPVDDLPLDVRKQVDCENGDYAISRRRSRTPSSIIDAQAADLLKEFRSAKTIVEAVISYSKAKKTDPEGTLAEAFPLIQRFVASRLLMPADSQEADAIVPSLGAS